MSELPKHESTRNRWMDRSCMFMHVHCTEDENSTQQQLHAYVTCQHVRRSRRRCTVIILAYQRSIPTNKLNPAVPSSLSRAHSPDYGIQIKIGPPFSCPCVPCMISKLSHICFPSFYTIVGQTGRVKWAGPKHSFFYLTRAQHDTI